MTRDEVDKASETQLDTWVAVHVMRWTAETGPDGRQWWRRDGGQKILQQEWNPSRSIGDAWQALEAVPEEWVIRRVSRSTEEQPQRLYRCELYCGPDRETADVYIQGPTPTIAIARAVLHATFLGANS